MPKLSECAQMSDNKLFRNLSKIAISDFYGLHPKQIQVAINLNEAVRYLTDLVIINDMNKSKFSIVSEKSSESMSEISKSILSFKVNLNQLNESIRQKQLKSMANAFQ